MRDLTAGPIARVVAIDFEYSPGRGDDRYTGDRSAFDVYVRYETPSGGAGFVGIEVKYREGLDDPVAHHRPRNKRCNKRCNKRRQQEVPDTSWVGGDDRYTGDRSAFDVYVCYETPSGGAGFVGIEVKYNKRCQTLLGLGRSRTEPRATKSNQEQPRATFHRASSGYRQQEVPDSWISSFYYVISEAWTYLHALLMSK